MSDKSGKKHSATIIDAGLGELDKIRGILFGRQMEAYEQRFGQLESTLEKNLASMQKQVDLQLNKLQVSVDSTVKALHATMQQESEERNQAYNQLESTLKTTIDQTEKSLSEALLATEDQSHQELIELKMSLAKQTDTTSEALDSLRTELVGLFKEQTGNLQSTKVDRESLAMVLDEITLRLRKEPK